LAIGDKCRGLSVPEARRVEARPEEHRQLNAAN
jgi:hypothetical protein